ncbi:Peptidase M20 [Macleaya cordata]|uniref:allantoate deiminase n=1 Tax=Macleaya cordata TaxID=56857 RepID=A0A200QZ34_MACCD|nr:Peptidase M20 [Macleaya cordata]
MATRNMILAFHIWTTEIESHSREYDSWGSGNHKPTFPLEGMEIGDTEEREKDLFPDILREEAVSRLNQLGKVSDADGHLERTFLSPASKRAINLVRSWMEDAGLRTWVDQMGNVHGRAAGMNSQAEALLIGSHLDTVIDAGIFDGPLGIVCAVSALKVLKISGKLGNLKRPIEVIAFSDEEGVRFQSTFLGSAAIAGTRPASALQISDKSGVTVQDVLKENSFDATEESYLQLKYDPRSVWGYIEVHIEQGPVLESLGLPLGVVKGIAGQTRLKVTVRGSQGHAGTVPMSMRQDPMAAAAELIVLLESICKHPENFISYDGHCNGFAAESLAGSLVCTVGEISSWPGASNVTFTVDLRTMDDMAREAIIFELSNRMYQTCDRRSVSCMIERKHDAGAVMCDTGLSSELKLAANSALKRIAGEIQDEVPVLMSGAGHDAMAMSHLTKVGMLFVRCRGGISHSPGEHVLDDDVWVAGLAILAFLETNLSSDPDMKANLLSNYLTIDQDRRISISMQYSFMVTKYLSERVMLLCPTKSVQLAFQNSRGSISAKHI